MENEISGYIFVSDLQGNFLAEDSFNFIGETTLVLENSTVHPDSISFTIVRSGHCFSMATQWGVPVGETLSFESAPSQDYGHTEVNFLNAPNCDRHMISSPGRFTHDEGNVPSSISVSIRDDYCDVFVGLFPAGQDPLGGWMHDVSRDVPESVMLYALDGEESEHSVTMYFKDASGVPYSMKKWGGVPSCFQKLDGDLIIASAQVDSFVLDSTIQWDHFSSEWEADYFLFNK